MSVVVRRYLGRSRLAEALVEDMPIIQHRDAMFVEDIEELVVECLELEKMSKYAWGYILDKLFSDQPMDDIDETGHAMKTASTKVVVVFERVNEIMKKAIALEYAINNSADFLIAHRAVSKIKDDVCTKFPPVDEQMVEKSVEAYKRGAYHSSEDLLRESQSQSS